MRSYKPEELFDEHGTLVPELRELPPAGDRRMSANPHANGGKLRQALTLPDFRDYAFPVEGHGTKQISPTETLGKFLRDVMRRNMSTFRVFSPDENASNRLQDLYQATKKTWLAAIKPEDADGTEIAPDGRVMEMLSEHTLEGWLEGYLLTGRHGLFNTYEAFAHIIDSMYNQYAKWLEKSKLEIDWRAPISSLNILITSLVWRQDHNGFTHEDPGFLDVVSNKSAGITRIYLPPDANCLLSVADHCLRSRDYVNVIVADKQPHLVYLDMDEAIIHCTKGIGIWEWASTDNGAEPDVVVASAGDILTEEALAAVAILRQHFPDLKIRFVNVVDLYRLQPDTEHPHGLSDRDFDSLFTKDKPVIFNFHGYPWLIHKFTYRRTNHDNIHVRGYKEKGNINTPLELAIVNQVDRYRPGHRCHRSCPEIAGIGRSPEGMAQGADHRKHRLRLRRRHRQTGNPRLEMAIGQVTGPLANFINVGLHPLKRERSCEHGHRNLRSQACSTHPSSGLLHTTTWLSPTTNRVKRIMRSAIYSKFLDCWKGGDANLKPIIDASKRLARLQSSRIQRQGVTRSAFGLPARPNIQPSTDFTSKSSGSPDARLSSSTSSMPKSPTQASNASSPLMNPD